MVQVHAAPMDTLLAAFVLGLRLARVSNTSAPRPPLPNGVFQSSASKHLDRSTGACRERAPALALRISLTDRTCFEVHNVCRESDPECHVPLTRIFAHRPVPRSGL